MSLSFLFQEKIFLVEIPIYSLSVYVSLSVSLCLSLFVCLSLSLSKAKNEGI